MNKRVYTLVYTFVLTLVFVAATSTVAVLLRGRIDLNERLLTRRVIVQAAGLLTGEAVAPQEIDEMYVKRLAPLTGRDTRGMQILTVDGGRGGYVFKTAGRGYWGQIEGYVGVNADLKTLTGLVFSKHGETPGLGGEITQEWFRDQFAGQPLKAPSPKAPIIQFVEPGAELGPNQVHAITGATRTSDGVKQFLNHDLRTFLEVMKD